MTKKMTIILPITLTILVSIGLATPPLQAAALKEKHVQGQILVQFKPGTSAKDSAEIASKQNGKIVRSLGNTAVHIVSVPEGKEAEVVGKLSLSPQVAYAELDLIGQAQTTDPYYSRQWALENIGQSFSNTAGTQLIPLGSADADIDAPEAWTITRGDGVRVAVLDSGIDLNHEDISSKVVARANFTRTKNTDDLYDHGTHVSGIIAATSSADPAAVNRGVVGACPDCVILGGKVLDDRGYGSVSSVVSGINWAVANGAKVINLSLGFYQPSATLETAINKAWDNGVVIVAAAGNDAGDVKLWPAYYSNVIAVAATNNKDEKASFSTYGASWVDVAAPGENIYATFPNHKFTIQRLYGRSLNYDVANGTSMAAPIVAATAALVWSTNPAPTNTEVRNRVLSTADKISGTDTYWANGRINAASAVGYASAVATP